MSLTLYSYFRSSSSQRVRIALNYKRLDYAYAPVHLLRDGGEQWKPDFQAVNPQGLVPVLEVREDGFPVFRLGQSLAILEYLEELYPVPPLLPADPRLRGRARQLAEIINSGVQPFQNLLVLRKVTEELGGDRTQWAQDFVQRGLRAFEALVRESPGPYSVCAHPTFADVCLVPQMHAARRFGVDLSPYPTCVAVEAACLALPAFEAAAPEAQPDTER